ncbi:flagellar biosynthesis anti-sigma factor FlgM [Thalassotalea hakodatensis]|uniref:flagellar biosynthesis anti-sigma factor FlgM n=1 Tax=Thalassotalea hakodatensis TaxID=3030492 RepID=UPI00257382F4|nr:flagellar biosynthesis anti-sigma factor FlgM [Thalassotalea hakodatensis]
MAININNLSNTGQVKQKVDQQTQLKQQNAQNATNTEQAKVASKDSFSITPQAKQLGDLQKKIEDSPIVDQKKVEELKKAITSGDYKINPEKLAASIASFEFDLAESV